MVSEDEEKQIVREEVFQQMYRKLTSEKIKQASDKVFSATSQELAAAYKPDDYSV